MIFIADLKKGENCFEVRSIFIDDKQRYANLNNELLDYLAGKSAQLRNQTFNRRIVRASSCKIHEDHDGLYIAIPFLRIYEGYNYIGPLFHNQESPELGLFDELFFDHLKRSEAAEFFETNKDYLLLTTTIDLKRI